MVDNNGNVKPRKKSSTKNGKSTGVEDRKYKIDGVISMCMATAGYLIYLRDEGYTNFDTFSLSDN